MLVLHVSPTMCHLGPLLKRLVLSAFVKFPQVLLLVLTDNSHGSGNGFGDHMYLGEFEIVFPQDPHHVVLSLFQLLVIQLCQQFLFVLPSLVDVRPSSLPWWRQQHGSKHKRQTLSEKRTHCKSGFILSSPSC